MTAVGEDVLIEYWIENRTYSGVRTSGILEIDGEEVSKKKDVTSEPNSTVKWRFRVTAERPGTRAVSLRNGALREYLTGQFTVTEPWLAPGGLPRRLPH